jgi:hypothetical protein
MTDSTLGKNGLNLFFFWDEMAKCRALLSNLVLFRLK